MAAAVKDDQTLDQYERVYQVKCIDVTGKEWEAFGYVLIGSSTIIMILQAASLGPSGLWKRADDVTTVLFTFELLVRIVEKGYLFFIEAEKNWNFFDSVVVAISLISMILSSKEPNPSSGGRHGAPNNAGMQNMKMLRTLRLLRLLRVCRVFKGIANVNKLVDVLLNTVGALFIVLVVTISFLALFATMAIATIAGAKAWLKRHTLPQFPKLS